nr:MAG TPA: hypothetical protein [Caudoviricetes sp.]
MIIHVSYSFLCLLTYTVILMHYETNVNNKCLQTNGR